MAKTSAQRQQDYRRQRPFAGPEGNGERRLNTWLSTAANLSLERLACRYGVTKQLNPPPNHEPVPTHRVTHGRPWITLRPSPQT